MNNQELQQRIDELTARLDEQSRLIQEQQQKITEIENKPAKLDRYLDVQSKDVIEESVNERILDIVWNDYFYYSTFIESIDRYYQYMNAGGNIIVNSNGLNLENDTSSTAIANVSLDILDIVSDADILKFSKETRFRTKLKIDNVSSVDLYISGPGSTNDVVAFNITSGTIKGETTSNALTTSINLGTLANDTYVSLEYRYYPGNRADFYVNGVLKGTSTSNLPRQSIGTSNVFYADLSKTATTSTSRTAYIMFFDVIQKK